MEEQFYTILTNIGKASIANASALGDKVNFKSFALGDGGGNYYNPVESQTELKNEVWRGAIGNVSIDEENPNWIILENIIPASAGGFMIREAGVFDDEGNLIAIGKYPETYKPSIENGSAKDLIIKMILEVSNTSVVTLKIDPTTILATKKDIDSLDGRVTHLESNRVKRYGVTFSGSNTQGTRVEDAVGMIANTAVDDEIVINDFDEVSFFNRPICCGYHDAKGKFHVNAYRGEPGFDWNGSNGEVFYEETPFYWKGDLHNYVSVSATPLEGYELAPRFKNGVDKVYSPVFWLATVGGKATSRAGVFPDRGSVNTHMAAARTYHANGHTEIMASRITDYILQLVEFATKDPQTAMMGACNMAYGNGYEATVGETTVNRIIIEKSRAENFVVGQTISIGTAYSNESIADNRIVTDIVSYDATNSAVYFDGAAVNIAVGNSIATRAWRNGATNIVTASSGSPGNNTSGKYPCIYRGKVDPWGNGWSAIADVLIAKTGTEESPVFTPNFLEDPTKYDGTINAEYIEMDYNLSNKNGYAITLGKDKRYPHIRLPDVVGGSSTTYLSNYFYIESSYGSPRALFAGGTFDQGRLCGPVCFLGSISPGPSSLHRLSRLFVTPSSGV